MVLTWMYNRVCDIGTQIDARPRAAVFVMFLATLLGSKWYYAEKNADFSPTSQNYTPIVRTVEKPDGASITQPGVHFDNGWFDADLYFDSEKTRADAWSLTGRYLIETDRLRHRSNQYDEYHIRELFRMDVNRDGVVQETELEAHRKRGPRIGC